jgi:hypothetical protein
MDIKKNRFIIIIFFLIIFAFIYSYNTYTPAFIAPDETLNYAFSQIYADTGNLYYEEELNSIAGGIIRPRGVKYIDNKIISNKFIGFPFYYGTIIVLTGADLLPYLTFLFSCIGMLSIYLLGKELFGLENGLISIFLLGFFPPYWYWSNFPLFETVFGSVFFILGLVYFIKLLNVQSLSNSLLTGIFFGISWNIRPDMILFLIPIFLISVLEIRKLKLRTLVISFTIFIFIISPVLLLNNDVYGGYLTTGHTVNTASSEGSTKVIPTPGILWQKDFSIMFDNLKNLINTIPLFPFFIIGLFICFSNIKFFKSNSRNMYLLFILLSILIFSLFYLAGSSQKHGGGLHESYTRYFFPIFLIIIPLFSLFIQKLRGLGNNGKIAIVLIIMLYIISCIFITYPQLEQKWKVREGYNNIVNHIETNTESNSIIFIMGLDKIVYPTRKVATINYLPKERKEKEIAEIAANLYEKNVSIYFYAYSVNTSLVEYELNNTNLQLRKIGKSELYKFITMYE